MTSTLDLREADGTTLLPLTNICLFDEARDVIVNYGPRPVRKWRGIGWPSFWRGHDDET